MHPIYREIMLSLSKDLGLLEKAWENTPPEEGYSKYETFRLLKGIVDSIVLRKETGKVELILNHLCSLITYRPEKVDEILEFFTSMAMNTLVDKVGEGTANELIDFIEEEMKDGS